MTDLIIIIVSLLVAAVGFMWHKKASANVKAVEKPSKGLKRNKKYSMYLIVIALYAFTTKVIAALFGKPQAKSIEVHIPVPRVEVFGLSLSTTVIITWCIMAVLIIIALIIRITLIPHLKDEPKGAQNVLELMIESILKYTKSTAHGVGEFLASYLFTVAIFLIGCACTEMFGFRTPASDITLTGALAILTFFIINIYGIKSKGVIGRIKSLAEPTPVVFPIRIITDMAVPVSLACRLFGNMLGGLVVMDLLYSALGGYAVGIPSVAGLYFNVFHPLIQAFIFVTLTLTFINEATE
jgi:F-type H+-transporting ATPase subunit a